MSKTWVQKDPFPPFPILMIIKESHWYENIKTTQGIASELTYT